MLASFFSSFFPTIDTLKLSVVVLSWTWAYLLPPGGLAPWAQVNQQRSSGREQELGVLSQYHLKEGQAPTAAFHSTSLRLDIFITKIVLEPRVP